MRFIIKFGDEDAVNDLLQEIYNESHNIRAHIISLFSKWNKDVNENGEIAAVGDKILKLIAALSKNQDQKIMILKYLKEVQFENENSNTSTESKSSLAKERKDELDSLIEKARKSKANKN
jgi:hypothetical protein